MHVSRPLSPSRYQQPLRLLLVVRQLLRGACQPFLPLHVALLSALAHHGRVAPLPRPLCLCLGLLGSPSVEGQLLLGGGGAAALDVRLRQRHDRLRPGLGPRRHFGGAPLCDWRSDTSGCWPELRLPPPQWPMGGAGAGAAAAGTCPGSLATAGPLESPVVAAQAATAGTGARSSFGNMKPRPLDPPSDYDPCHHSLTSTKDSTHVSVGLFSWGGAFVGWRSSNNTTARRIRASLASPLRWSCRLDPPLLLSSFVSHRAASPASRCIKNDQPGRAAAPQA